MLQMPQMAVHGRQLPAFTRLCMVAGPRLVGGLAILAAAYCLWVWFRKTEARASWVGFLATTMASLVFVLLPTMVAMYLPVIDAINQLGAK
jgi:glycerol-3-phosphate acyltransferase PlsY